MSSLTKSECVAKVMGHKTKCSVEFNLKHSTTTNAQTTCILYSISCETVIAFMDVHSVSHLAEA